MQNTIIPSASDTLKILCLRANRGVSVKITRDLGVKPQSVQQVYRGEASARRITEALRRRGAPVEVEG